MLKMQDVSKIYRTELIETYALRRFSLEVSPGEFVAITGPSGSGKTTFLNVAGLLEEFDSGSYLLEGRDVRSLSDDERSRLRNERIGFIFQSFNLIPDLDVYDNVEVPLRYRRLSGADRRERIGSALELVGLASRAKHMPSQLSGGQQQRVAIARAIAGDPAFLLADEPTGNLDSLMSRQVMDLLEQINEMGTTILLVTHDPELARRATFTWSTARSRTSAPTSRIRASPAMPARSAPSGPEGTRSARRSEHVRLLPATCAQELRPQSGHHRPHGDRDRPRHRRVRDDAHRVSRHVGQPHLVEERPAVRGHHGQLGSQPPVDPLPPGTAAARDDLQGHAVPVRLE